MTGSRTPIASIPFLDGSTREIFLDADGRQFVLDDEGQPVITLGRQCYAIVPMRFAVMARAFRREQNAGADWQAARFGNNP
jgi:hypothetical protein